jgi:hypothetical protein
VGFIYFPLQVTSVQISLHGVGKFYCFGLMVAVSAGMYFNKVNIDRKAALLFLKSVYLMDQRYMRIELHS